MIASSGGNPRGPGTRQAPRSVPPARLAAASPLFVRAPPAVPPLFHASVPLLQVPLKQPRRNGSLHAHPGRLRRARRCQGPLGHPWAARTQKAADLPRSQTLRSRAGGTLCSAPGRGRARSRRGAETRAYWGLIHNSTVVRRREGCRLNFCEVLWPHAFLAAAAQRERAWRRSGGGGSNALAAARGGGGRDPCCACALACAQPPGSV